MVLVFESSTAILAFAYYFRKLSAFLLTQRQHRQVIRQVHKPHPTIGSTITRIKPVFVRPDATISSRFSNFEAVGQDSGIRHVFAAAIEHCLRVQHLLAHS